MPASKKDWWKSKTVWAGIATIAVGAFGIDGVSPDELAAQADKIITAVLGVIAIYGRLTAKTEIGKKDPEVID